MRDYIVKDLKYFDSFVEEKQYLIRRSIKKINNDEIPYDKIPGARFMIFLKSLEIFIAKYSMGIPIENLKNDYNIPISYMIDGWDDYVVKFSQGRPPKIYDHYMINQYCYMVWMLSFAILLDATQDEVLVLERLIKNGRIKDDFILFLLTNLTGQVFNETDETISKPFKNLYKDGAFQNIDSKHIKKYLNSWYKNTKLLTWHSYDLSVEKSRYFYYGYWSIETAAIVAVLDLDDSSFKNNKYYPSDLVDFYRKSRR